MNDIISIFKKDIKNLILNLKDDNIIDDINLKTISIDYSSKSKQGDLSTNIFIILSKKKLNKKIDIEKFLKEYFENLFYIDNIIIAKAGFINIFLKKNFLLSKLKDLFKQTDKITLNVKKKKNINIEFVSANPTGPTTCCTYEGGCFRRCSYHLYYQPLDTKLLENIMLMMQDHK